MGAMVLSLTAHAGLLVLLLSAGARHIQGAPDQARKPVISVYLARSTMPGDASPIVDNTPAGLPEGPGSRLRSLGEVDAVSRGPEPLVEIAAPLGPYYFRASELSRRPVLLGDAISHLIIELPGFSPVPVILRLLISAEGSVDRVVVEDSYLSDAVEARIVEAFSGVRFLPGKIGDTAVRSQLKIEVRLENLPDDQRQAGSTHGESPAGERSDSL